MARILGSLETRWAATHPRTLSALCTRAHTESLVAHETETGGRKSEVLFSPLTLPGHPLMGGNTRESQALFHSDFSVFLQNT